MMPNRWPNPGTFNPVSHPTRAPRIRRRIAAFVAGLMTSAAVWACNIPVFRYALERWTPDVCEIILFTEKPLSTDEDAFVRSLERQSSLVGGPANSRVIRAELQALTPELNSLWQSLQQSPNRTPPYVVIRSRYGKDRVANHWSGPLQDSLSVPLLDSPVRRELARRLQKGDAIVWLVLKPTVAADGKDSTATTAALNLLQEQCQALPGKLELPEGIGLQGSELYSEVPLLLQFSVLELSAADPQEQYLIRQLTGFQPAAFDAGEALIVPVFGRGRALEVIPASRLDADLIEDLSRFLCSACSCQVKEQNPGFDLLISTPWNTELFGEDAQLPPAPPVKGTGRSEKPTLLPIPPGRQPAKR